MTPFDHKSHIHLFPPSLSFSRVYFDVSWWWVREIFPKCFQVLSIQSCFHCCRGFWTKQASDWRWCVHLVCEASCTVIASYSVTSQQNMIAGYLLYVWAHGYMTTVYYNYAFFFILFNLVMHQVATFGAEKWSQALKTRVVTAVKHQWICKLLHWSSMYIVSTTFLRILRHGS